ncbi:MAG: hypothetical protein AB3N17_00635 [Tateyamaria sp.]
MASSARAQGIQIEPLNLDVAGEGALVQTSFAAASDLPVFSQSIAVEPGVVPVAVRQLDTLPQPSIILGRIAPGQEEEFGIERLLPETVAQVIFDLADLDARNALRADNPELFAQLISEGHLDPEADQLNRTLQVELQRMNCYRSGIDGAWGPGSRRSVASYFEQLANVSWPDQQPTNELFRAILLNGDVACPTPVAAPRPAATNRTTTRTTTTTTTRTQRPAAAAPAPAAKPQTQSKPTLSIGGSGVFR